ncbi:MAG: porin family protein [Xanthobacteraceae bacterium]|nr:porin family protein [Xanthobacteraceae bacterium]
MKRLLVAAIGLASLGLVTASVPATAADIAPRRMAPVAAPAYLPFNWGGWYAGLNLGGGVGGDVTGVIFGGQIGYNWQVNQIVFGLETDLQFSGQDDTFLVRGTSVSNELDWFGTFRGRIGIVVFDRWLPYFTGGLAYGGRTIKVGGVSADDTALGWAVGVGVDYAITNQWSARLEYLHISLEDFSATFPGGVGLVNSGRLDNDIIRGAVNYRFLPY